MDLTIDDCMALAARECATDHELRAALCVAVGQALHARYEARGYCEAAEVAKRDACRARDLSEVASRDYATIQHERDEARAIAGMRDRALTAAVQEREAFGLRASAAERERDEARAALDLSRESAREAREEIAGALALVDETRSAYDALRARPTYEARTVAPTPGEIAAHEAAGAMWLVRNAGWGFRVLKVYRRTLAIDVSAGMWIALGASGLPCAWPVAVEVMPL